MSAHTVVKLRKKREKTNDLSVDIEINESNLKKLDECKLNYKRNSLKNPWRIWRFFATFWMILLKSSDISGRTVSKTFLSRTNPSSSLSPSSMSSRTVSPMSSVGSAYSLLYSHWQVYSMCWYFVHNHWGLCPGGKKRLVLLKNKKIVSIIFICVSSSWIWLFWPLDMGSGMGKKSYHNSESLKNYLFMWIRDLGRKKVRFGIRALWVCGSPGLDPQRYLPIQALSQVIFFQWSI